MIVHDHIYRRTVDPAGNDSQAMIMRRLRRESEVLELGPATGYLARAIGEKLDGVVDAIEIHPAMAREAEPWCRKLVVGNLEAEDLEAHFGQARYDFIICADVLEHLRDPAAVLKQLPVLLKPSGRLIISIPNSAYTGLILELIAGDFPYRSEGLLDNTHLRFYTRRSFIRMLGQCGFRAISVEPVPLPYENSEFAHRFADAPGEVLDYLLSRDYPDAYQFVITAEAAGAGRGPGQKAATRPAAPVDVIVPVYRGMEETRRCIEAVLASPQQTAFELLVIDDDSPDPAVKTFLKEQADAGSITLLTNPKNLGFTETVNRGAQLHPERDLFLLNSDTEVANDWLDRIQACAYSDAAFGTVTPFSNNATICSYPRFCEDNPLPEGWSVGELDALFRSTNAGQVGELPTAVGCAMYIKRDCLDAIGLFDAGYFPRGYGEENDFCMRASRSGWRHALCADTFIFHSGGVSFDAASEKNAAAQEIIRELHPDYEIRVREHVMEDPNRPLRNAVDRARTALGNSTGRGDDPETPPPESGERLENTAAIGADEGGREGLETRQSLSSRLRRWLSAATGNRPAS